MGEPVFSVNMVSTRPTLVVPHVASALGVDTTCLRLVTKRVLHV